MPETNFFWDPLSDNILQERDETGAVTAEYTTEPGLYGNLISQNRSGVESQYQFDAVGSALALTDDSQQVTDTNAYTAFGEVTERTGNTPTPFQYGGEHGYYWVSATVEHMVRRRTLDPSQGRWLSIDPLLRVGQPDSFYDNNWFGDRLTGMRNTYGYASNDPVNRADPSGLHDGRAAGDCGAAAADCAISIPFPFFGDVTLRYPCGSLSIDPGEHTVDWTGKGSCPSGVLGRTFVPRRVRAAVNKRLKVPRQFTTPCPDPCVCVLTELVSFPIEFPFQTKQKIYCMGFRNLDCWDPDNEDTELPPEGAGYKECELDIKLQIKLRVKLSGGTCK